MKRTIIILSVMFTLSIAGILYGNHGQSDERETVSIEEWASDFCPDPITSYPLY